MVVEGILRWMDGWMDEWRKGVDVVGSSFRFYIFIFFSKFE